MQEGIIKGNTKVRQSDKIKNIKVIEILQRYFICFHLLLLYHKIEKLQDW